VFGERVEARQLLFRRAAERLQLHERPQLLLHVPDRLAGPLRVLAGLPRRVPEPRELLAELPGLVPHLVQLAPYRRDLRHRLRRVGVRLLELPPQLLEHRALPLERVEAGPGLERLRRQLLQ